LVFTILSRECSTKIKTFVKGSLFARLKPLGIPETVPIFDLLNATLRVLFLKCS
jgi:hypothetical protein